MSNLKDKPILFSTEMVKDISVGRKTQTRRVIKKPVLGCDCGDLGFYVCANKYTGEQEQEQCEFCYTNPNSVFNAMEKSKYKVGQKLWVRETWCHAKEYSKFDGYIYKADFPCKIKGAEEIISSNFFRWKPSIFMPKEACRIKLKITDIRIERVQEINICDSINEGIDRSFDASSIAWYKNYGYPKNKEHANFKDPIKSFKTLWDSINLKCGYGWDTNPWVTVIDFKKIN